MAQIKHVFDTAPVEFSNKLLTYMTKHNISQRQLSDRAGVSKNTVRRYLQDLEKEDFFPRPDIVKRFELAMKNHDSYKKPHEEIKEMITLSLIYTGPIRTFWQPVTPWIQL